MSDAFTVRRISPRPRPGLLRVCTLLFLTVGLPAGCGPRAGTLLYFLGAGLGQKTPAEFTLPRGPMLILVDDDLDLVQPRTARDALVDALATELKRHNLADRVTTNEELARLRQQHPDFDKRGAREVGRLARADTVIWLKVTRFAVEDNLEMVHQDACFAVGLKVIDATAEVREAVVLWPKQPEGRTVEICLPPRRIRSCRDLNEVHQLLAESLAVDIASLFREREPGT